MAAVIGTRCCNLLRPHLKIISCFISDFTEISENWWQSAPNHVVIYKRRQPHRVTLHKIHGGSAKVTSPFASAYNDLDKQKRKTATEQNDNHIIKKGERP